MSIIADEVRYVEIFALQCFVIKSKQYGWYLNNPLL